MFYTKYEDIFTDRQPYYNMYIVGKKHSGKSYLLY